ncbi:2-polyprenyl-6-methoxyphenol hydroxylase [Talaromyces proteolyticus]|uniref:2-polyprenyl-6-methoxyphenol hydroxylase n=1 Tax=Talaromyces proteolyticus TaxID=1131652 RepID=A0AAD4PUS1_9EURO|nr:2-polyprenyl-6-methoxyphenol hydroxylase [Talaromyces proteolyticus]KAH8690474.1 2-polyprenyl-6-methoxyphenol hydroxylase [Talaromyces proteolyticus]
MKVIIAGGGIAGLATAIGLRRAGHQVKVFERSAFLREVGAAIHVCPNASRVLLDWGLKAEEARLVSVRRSVVAAANTLKPIVETDCSSISRRFGAPWYLAHRVDLHSALRCLATTKDGLGLPVEIFLRSEVVQYDADEGSITLADSSVHYADLVIAADGVHTTAVDHVIGHSVPPVSTGSAAFRFLISTKELLKDPETAPMVTDNDGVFKVLVADDSRRLVWYPCANSTLQNFVGIHPDQQVGDYEDWNLSVDVNDVLSQYRDNHPSILAILKKANNVKRWPLLYRDPIPTWHRGRLVLVGDAAHPMLPHQGQGGAQAIEDAGALGVIFSGSLSDPSSLHLTIDDINKRLVLFENVRYNRASAMQIFSNAGQDESWKIRERAQQYMSAGAEVPTSPPEFIEHNFGYDVQEKAREQLREFLETRS